MPSFVCEACNDTVKKSTVQRHKYKCRNAWSFTCIDCSHTFDGDEINAHTSCITEAQKYQGKLYQPKKKVSKPATTAAVASDARKDQAATSQNNKRKASEVDAESNVETATAAESARSEVDVAAVIDDMMNFRFKKTLTRLVNESNGSMERGALVDACTNAFIEQFSPVLRQIADEKVRCVCGDTLF
jgi:cell growth-regulating nucleolar protein